MSTIYTGKPFRVHRNGFDLETKQYEIPECIVFASDFIDAANILQRHLHLGQESDKVFLVPICKKCGRPHPVQVEVREDRDYKAETTLEVLPCDRCIITIDISDTPKSLEN